MGGHLLNQPLVFYAHPASPVKPCSPRFYRCTLDRPANLRQGPDAVTFHLPLEFR